MKKTFLKAMAVLTALSATVFFTACDDDPVKPDENTTEVSFENPRFMAEADGSIYVTSYYPLGVARFDIGQQKFTDFCKLGQFHPEGIAAAGGKLYIASSSISDESGTYSYDNKLYVVDIASFKLVDSITVSRNPQIVKRLDDSHIVFNTWGDYVSDLGGTYILNTNNKEIVDLNKPLTKFDVYNGSVYGYATTYNEDYTTSTNFYKIDGNSHNVTTILENEQFSDGIYGISVTGGYLAVCTDGNYIAKGDCRFYSIGDGSLAHTSRAGLLPSNVVADGTGRFLILNEGNWGKNNAGITQTGISDTTTIDNYFEQSNSRGLGDVAQDIILVDGKAYITVTFSNSLEIMNPTTGKSTRIATSK